MGAALLPFTKRPISATSDTYWAVVVPGFCATFRTPGMWLTENSMCGRTSRTVALLSAMICRSCSVEISGVLGFGSPNVTWKMLAADCAALDVGVARSGEADCACNTAVANTTAHRMQDRFIVA